MLMSVYENFSCPSTSVVAKFSTVGMNFGKEQGLVADNYKTEIRYSKKNPPKIQFYAKDS